MNSALLIPVDTNTKVNFVRIGIRIHLLLEAVHDIRQLRLNTIEEHPGRVWACLVMQNLAWRVQNTIKCRVSIAAWFNMRQPQYFGGDPRS